MDMDKKCPKDPKWTPKWTRNLQKVTQKGHSKPAFRNDPKKGAFLDPLNL